MVTLYACHASPDVSVPRSHIHIFEGTLCFFPAHSIKLSIVRRLCDRVI